MHTTGVVTELQRGGLVFRIADPVDAPAFRRWVCGREVYYHGRIVVEGNTVTSRPTQWATHNRAVHMDTLLAVWETVKGNAAVWDSLPGGGRVCHIFGPDRSLDL